jgi:hypothetical protein
LGRVWRKSSKTRHRAATIPALAAVAKNLKNVAVLDGTIDGC